MNFGPSDSDKKKESKKFGIYNIKGIKGKSKVKIIPVGMIDLSKDEYVADKLENHHDIIDKVVGEVYTCNITDNFLMSSKKLPIMYISIIMDRPMRRIFLLKMYLCFTITSEIKTSDDLINKSLEGYFSLEVIIDKERTEIKKEIKKYPGIKEMENDLINFIKTDEMKDLIQGLVDEENERLRIQYQKEYGSYKIPKATINLEDYLD